MPLITTFLDPDDVRDIAKALVDDSEIYDHENFAQRKMKEEQIKEHLRLSNISRKVELAIRQKFERKLSAVNHQKEELSSLESEQISGLVKQVKEAMVWQIQDKQRMETSYQKIEREGAQKRRTDMLNQALKIKKVCFKLFPELYFKLEDFYGISGLIQNKELKDYIHKMLHEFRLALIKTKKGIGNKIAMVTKGKREKINFLKREIAELENLELSFQN